MVIAGATRAFRPHDEHIIQEYELALDGMRLSPGSKCVSSPLIPLGAQRCALRQQLCPFTSLACTSARRCSVRYAPPCEYRPASGTRDIMQLACYEILGGIAAGCTRCRVPCCGWAARRPRRRGTTTCARGLLLARVLGPRVVCGGCNGAPGGRQCSGQWQSSSWLSVLLDTQVRINSSVIGDGGALESADSGGLLLPSKTLAQRASGEPHALPPLIAAVSASGASPTHMQSLVTPAADLGTEFVMCMRMHIGGHRVCVEPL